MRQYLRKLGAGTVEKPETNRRKVVARLARDGWIERARRRA
jgi:hypothetical protein